MRFCTPRYIYVACNNYFRSQTVCLRRLQIRISLNIFICKQTQISIDRYRHMYIQAKWNHDGSRGLIKSFAIWIDTNQMYISIKKTYDVKCLVLLLKVSK